MARKGLEHKFNYLEVLSEKKIEHIHQGTLKVLNDTGIVVKDVKMLNLLSEIGCKVDFKTERVRFPESIVMESLKKSPSTFTGRARDTENDVILSSGKSSFFVAACGMKTIDLDTWEVREPSRKEFYDNLIVLDALQNVDIQNCFPYFGFAKVPQCMRLLESTAAKFRVSTKVQIEGSVFDNYRWNIEMAKAVDADLFQLVNSAAPLTYFKEVTDQIFYYAQNDMPFHFAAGPTRGLTAPSTIAGALISNNAEALAGIVMAQAVKPGSRVWVNSMVMTPNMANGNPAFGDIGNALTDAAFNQMWRYYQIPSWTNCSSWTSSKVIDYQAGYEMSMAAMTSALTGSSVISFQGGLNAELSVHPVKAIIDDDVAGMIKRFMQGVEVSEETLAVDIINQVGPMPGSFLEEDHTFSWWRKECYIPSVASRNIQEEWIKSGKKNTLDIAREKMEAILQNHKFKPLPASQEQAIELILQEARKEYRKKGMISDEEWRLYEEDLNSPNYPYA